MVYAGSSFSDSLGSVALSEQFGGSNLGCTPGFTEVSRPFSDLISIIMLGPARTSMSITPTLLIVVVAMSLGLAMHPYRSIDQPSSGVYEGVY